MIFSLQPLKDIRSKIENSWKALLHLVCAIRMTQELQKRNEILKIEQIKNYMLTQFPEKKEVLPSEEKPMSKNDDEFLESPIKNPINLETISTEDISTMSVKTNKSTGSLIASALSSQPLTEIPMNADFSLSTKYAMTTSPAVDARNCKVHFDLSKKPVLRGDIQDSKSTPKKGPKTPPQKLIISKEDLIKLPGKCGRSSPALSRSSSVVDEATTKGGIFEERKKMFERSEAFISYQKLRGSRSPKCNNSSNE